MNDCSVIYDQVRIVYCVCVKELFNVQHNGVYFVSGIV